MNGARTFARPIAVPCEDPIQPVTKLMGQNHFVAWTDPAHCGRNSICNPAAAVTFRTGLSNVEHSHHKHV